MGVDFQLAFPHQEYPPTHVLKLGAVLSIAVSVFLNLGSPVFLIGSRKPEIFAFLVSVPKTAVDKNNDSKFWQNNVRVAWQGLDMPPIPKSVRVKKLPHNHFRMCILRADFPHN